MSESQSPASGEPTPKPHDPRLDASGDDQRQWQERRQEVSAEKLRKAGAPAFPGRRPELRLVKNPDERPRPEPDSGLRAILADINRCHRA